MEFFLVSTNHLKDGLWFRDDEDFKVGMNYVAVLAHSTKVSVICFVLMSNHLHFVLGGTMQEAVLFITRLKQMYGRYYQRRWGVKEFLRRNGVDIGKIQGGRDALERAMAYVQMNPVAANICLEASGYPWGTGNSFFKMNPVRGRRVDTISGREMSRILHSREKINGRYLLGDNGYILPESYVSVAFFERVMRSPNRYRHFLLTSSKAKVSLEKRNESLPSFTDQSVLHCASDLCRTLFQTESLKDLRDEQLAEILKQLKRRLACDALQLSRALGIDYSRTAKYLDSY